MRTKLLEALPRRFMEHPSGGGIIVEGEVKASKGSRLSAKVLVFKDKAGLDAFWSGALNQEAGECLALVTTLGYEVVNIGEKGETSWRECDPNYFCVMGFVLGSINMEIICHECVHAAYRYVMRVKGMSMAAKAFDLDEEQVAYPTGRLARGINVMFHDLGVYEDQRKMEAA